MRKAELYRKRKTMELHGRGYSVCTDRDENESLRRRIGLIRRQGREQVRFLTSSKRIYKDNPCRSIRCAGKLENENLIMRGMQKSNHFLFRLIMLPYLLFPRSKSKISIPLDHRSSYIKIMSSVVFASIFGSDDVWQ